MDSAVCQRCGITFQPIPRSKGRFCTRSCWRAYATAHKMTANCAVCGKEFFVIAADLAKGHDRLCSQKCLMVERRRKAESRIEERFWSFVSKTDGCWEWTGNRDRNGYGRIMMPVILACKLAHRLSYEIHNGPIPGGLFVLHHCDNPPCVRPDHLFLGNQLANARDCSRKGRTTRGERAANSKLTEAQVVEIRALGARDDANYSAISRSYGVSRSTIRDIINRSMWSHVRDQ